MALRTIKCTHMNLYLNSRSHHHPSYKHAVLSTLYLCDQDSLHAEWLFLRNIFRKNGYTDLQIRRALNLPSKVVQPDEKPYSVAFLPYVGSIFSRISRVLSRHNIKSVGLPSVSQVRPTTEDSGSTQRPL
jgi:hypothetical protein